MKGDHERAGLGLLQAQPSLLPGLRGIPEAVQGRRERRVDAGVCLEKAGERALDAGAFREAIAHLDACSRLASGGGNGVSPARMMRWERLAGDAYSGLFEMSEARRRYERALSLAGRPLPANRVLLGIWLLRSIAGWLWIQIGTRDRSPRRSGSPAPDAEDVCRAMLGCQKHAAMGGETGIFAGLVLETHILAERACPESATHVMALAGSALLAGTLGFYDLARALSHRAHAIAERRGHGAGLAYAAFLDGQRLLGRADLAAARRALDLARNVTENLGDWRAQYDVFLVGHFVSTAQGDFSRSASELDLASENACGRDSSTLRAGVAICRAEHLLPQGETGAALQSLEFGRKALPSATRAGRLMFPGLLAASRYRVMEFESARQEAAACIAWVERGALSLSFPLFSLGLAGDAVSAMNDECDPADATARRELENLTIRFRKQLRRAAARFPIGVPTARRFEGNMSWRASRRRQARRYWQESLEAARRIGMPYEQGLTLYEIGRHLPASDPARRQHLEEAIAILDRLGATWDLERARKALARS